MEGLLWAIVGLPVAFLVFVFWIVVLGILGGVLWSFVGGTLKKLRKGKPNG